MASTQNDRNAVKRAMLAAVLLTVAFALAVSSASAQGSRKDDIVFGPSGHPVANATITVCQPTATGTPCSPLATLYTDAILTATSPNPFQADGIGNYHFYAPAGRYLVQVSARQISGVISYPDVILPARVLTPANYAGTSSSTGNYQSTNASLTYNNGIGCGCNVTGAEPRQGKGKING